MRVWVTISSDGVPIVGNEGTVISHLEVNVPYFDLGLYGLSDYYRYGTENGSGSYVNDTIVRRPTALHLYLYMIGVYYLGYTPEQVTTGQAEIVGADGSRESDINLAIARRLEGLLILLGEETRMTRTDDRSIHSEGAATLREKKRSDLKNRVALVNGTQGAILVSIHQNSLPSSKRTHGAQVFYGIEEGSAALANAVQRLLNETVNLENQKAEKSIDPSIYLMKNVTAPAILIECGFLSNENETALLKSADYQQKLAVVIATGLLRPAQ